jgi:hypothetical protein
MEHTINNDTYSFYNDGPDEEYISSDFQLVNIHSQLPNSIINYHIKQWEGVDEENSMRIM